MSDVTEETQVLRALRGIVEVQHNATEDSLDLMVHTADNRGVEALVRIPTHQITQFMHRVIFEGGRALESSAGRIATGYCSECSNRGVLVIPAEPDERQDHVIRCPECGPRWRNGREAFATAPNPFGRGRWQ